MFELDRHARESWLSGIDPRIKTSAIIFTLAVISFSTHLAPLFLCGSILVPLLVLSGVPPKHFFRFIAPAAPLWLLPVVSAFIFDGQEVAALVFLRVLTALSAIFVLGSTTPFSAIVASLRWFRLPPLLCTLLVFTYRSIFVLLDGFGNMLLAMTARGFGGGKNLLDRRAFTVISAAVGAVFVRSFGRASSFGSALKARGFRMDSNFTTLRKPDPADLAVVVPLLCVDIAALVVQSVQSGVLA